MKAGNIKLPDGYTKEFRQAVKQNKSNAWLYRLLNDIYKAGYLQAVRDYTNKINQEIDNAVNQSLSAGHDMDGEQFQSDGGELGAGPGSSTAYADRDQGSEPGVWESEGTAPKLV